MSRVQGPRVRVNVQVQGDADVQVNVNVNGPREPLWFGDGNAKLPDGVRTFSIPAGHTCPYARDCKAKADRETGRITDGRETQWRCYAASNESRPSVRKSRWRNLELLRACQSKEEIVQLILDSLSPFVSVLRVHDSGDFYSQLYFDAWLEVARRRPNTRFYAYTKALPFWVRRKDSIPANFVLTASYGGTHDHLIEEHGLRYARVVLSEGEAEALGLEIDHDDSHAMRNGESFALLIHGTQPKDTPAAKAVAALRASGDWGYGRHRQRITLPLVN